ncbi:MAG: hypothetical protein AB8D78_05060 [Akkermansiaceae bacterium]
MPAEPAQSPFSSVSIRTVTWSLCLLLATSTCLAWSLIPSLEALPKTRVALFAITGFAMLGLVFFFPNCSNRNAARLILFSAVLLRLILWPAPVSDDVNRYSWEGKLVASGENPYSAPADHPRWQDRRDETWHAMNHRDQPTAYPPGIQWIMAGAAAIHPSLKSFKVVALLGDFAVLLLIFSLLRENAAPLRWAGFYAFNPVTLISFGAEAHFDSFMIAAFLAAILAATRSKHKTAWLLLGLAIQFKIVAIVLLPLFLNKKSIHSIWVLALVLLLPSIPFASAIPEWISAVRTFANSGDFNAPIFSFLATTGLSTEIIRAACSAGFVLTATAICVARWKGFSLIDSSLWMIGALIAFSPIVHFWYLAWILPLATLRPSFAWTSASITVAGYFLAWHTQATMGWWGYGHIVAILIWIPWLLAGLAQNRFLIQKIRNISQKASIPDPHLSIVIPAWKIDSSLQKLAQILRSQIPTNVEIIISICSPTEERILGTKTVFAPRGRGNQIAAGVHATHSPWILIAHADATPPTNFYESITTAITKNPSASLIVFGQRFDRSGLGTLLVEALNEIRVVFGGVAFGDQTMVVRRSALDSCGGFPSLPLMEDVEASLRLATQGRVQYIGCEWSVSAKKWNQHFSRRFISIIRLVASYQLARLRGPKQAEAVAKKMYTEYYNEKSAN